MSLRESTFMDGLDEILGHEKPVGKLKPYADDQLSTSMNSELIERIPMLVNPLSGEVIPEFQNFYEAVVSAVLNENISALYDISDKKLDKSQFNYFYNKRIGKEIRPFLPKQSAINNIDIELNMGRFQDGCRNILGGLYINGYRCEMVVFNEVLGTTTQRGIFVHGELLFTYKNKEFELLSFFPQTTISELEG